MTRRASLAAVAALGFFASVFGAGEALTYPMRRSIGLPPSDLAAETISIRSNEGQSLAGWLVRGKPGFGAVLLLHGVRSDRRQMIGRAKFLNHLGYSALLVDLPSHGESSGERITYGLNEAVGVRSAMTYLSQEFPSERIGAIGVSLGAASLVLSEPGPPLSAVVLESMFPTIRDAVVDRLDAYFGPAGGLLGPLLLWQLPLRLNISPDQLRPIAEIGRMHVPVLIASGDADTRTPLAETERVYEAANQPKELWIVGGAAHVDLYAFDPLSYEAKVSDFLARHLRHG